MVNMQAKFEVSGSNRSRDMDGGPKIPKVGHVTPSRPPLTYFFIFIVSAAGGQSARKIWSFLLKPFPRYGGGPKISKVGHVTPSRPPLT